MSAHFQYERYHWDRGVRYIAGIDEVGRGALCGPVLAAAVVLSPHAELSGVEDSKKLTAPVREALFRDITSCAIAVGVGCASAKEIDAINILNATRLAMLRAIKRLPIRPEFLLIDAVRLGESGIPFQSIIRGDEQSKSIAAASIVAKVIRDRVMTIFARHYPDYDLERNKGYGTQRHRDALQKIGPCRIHRATFRSARSTLGLFDDPPINLG